MSVRPEPAVTIDVIEDEAGRVDRLLARRYPDTPRRLLDELFDDGAVRIDGRKAKKGDRVNGGDEVTLARVPPAVDDLRVTPDPEIAARLLVLHTDDDVVVVAKPAGVPSQPLRPGELGTAAGGIVHLHPECATASEDPRDGGLVHRLDVGTSGVLIAARTREAWTRLRAAFGAGKVDKEYLALVDRPPFSDGCDLPLIQRGKRAVVDLTEGLDASTTWETAVAHGEHRLLRCQATTARMHQVRAHLAQCGAPIVGDVRYGGTPHPAIEGFFLHAAVVRFPGPSGRITVKAPLPADRIAVLDDVGIKAP